jgi:hypothetical protein
MRSGISLLLFLAKDESSCFVNGPISRDKALFVGFLCALATKELLMLSLFVLFYQGAALF